MRFDHIRQEYITEDGIVVTRAEAMLCGSLLAATMRKRDAKRLSENSIKEHVRNFKHRHPTRKGR